MKISGANFKVIEFSILMIVLAHATLASVRLPPTIRMCPKTLKPQAYNKCAKNVINDLKSHLASTPAFNPLVVPKLALNVDIGYLQASVLFKNTVLKDLTKFVINDLRVDPIKLTFYMNVQAPNIFFKSAFNFKGKYMNALPIEGVSAFQTNFQNSNLVLVGQGKTVVDRSGVERLALESFKVSVEVGDYKQAKLDLPPAYSAIPAVKSGVAKALNNHKEFLTVSKPYVDIFVTKAFKDIFSKVLNSFTKDELLPSA